MSSGLSRRGRVGKKPVAITAPALKDEAGFFLQADEQEQIAMPLSPIFDGRLRLPLIAAPMLSEDMLDRLQHVRVTRESAHGEIKESYTITGYTRFDDMTMTLHSDHAAAQTLD